MKTLVVLGLCLVVVPALSSPEWETFKCHHKRTFPAKEEHERKKVFMHNRKKMDDHNSRFMKGEVPFQVRSNRFTDMPEEEVKAVMNGYAGATKKTGIPYVDDGKSPPATVDWRKKGVVTPVRDQGMCGSCWAFATVGTLSSVQSIKTGNPPVSLSVQELIDCSRKYGNSGCDGGLMKYAYDYIEDRRCLATNESYPYTAMNSANCSSTNKCIVANVTGYVDIPQGNETALMKAVSKRPVASAVDASQWTFLFYRKGYGTENGTDYWIVKNSWGSEWGENGYFRMARNCNNHCGIATMASYPRVV